MRPLRALNTDVTVIALDAAAQRKPGADRGLGRNLAAFIEFFDRDANYAAHTVDVAVLGARRWAELVELVPRGLALRRSDARLYHSMSPYHVVPGFIPRSVVSILDVISYEARPRWKGTGAKTRFFFRMAREAAAILTISEYSRSRIIDRLGVSPDHVFAVPLPVPRAIRDWSHDECRLPEPLRDRTYVVGLVDLRGTDNRKRYPWLLGARLQLERLGIPVVLVGPGSETFARSGVGLGRISDYELAEILSHARALIFPSAYEGQGMPPLEAMSLGTPVIAFDNSSLREVVGQGGILLDDGLDVVGMTRAAHSPDDEAVTRIVAAARSLVEDEQRYRTLAARALERSRQFSVERFDAGVRGAYQFAIEQAER